MPREHEDKSELSRLIDKIAKKLAGVKQEAKEDKTGVVVKEISPDISHGIYLFDINKRAWIRLEESDQHLEPKEDGVYVVYFNNTKCPACRVFDIIWNIFVSNAKDTSIKYYSIVCKWFTHECESKSAKESFKKYNVKSSPTVLIWKVRSGSIVFTEKIEGVTTPTKLAEAINKVQQLG